MLGLVSTLDLLVLQAVDRLLHAEEAHRMAYVYADRVDHHRATSGAIRMPLAEDDPLGEVSTGLLGFWFVVALILWIAPGLTMISLNGITHVILSACIAGIASLPASLFMAHAFLDRWPLSTHGGPTNMVVSDKPLLILAPLSGFLLFLVLVL